MEDIYQPNETFDFNKLLLLTPSSLNGGNYFIKFRINGSPLYIQPPKCKTKQAIIKSGKRIFCDLMFNNENEAFIEWMEALETYCQKKLFENKAKWFESDLDEHDIENSFTSPLKVIKSGKFYSSRITIPSLLGTCNLKVYNEDEEEVNIDNIKENTDIMTILEVQGIRCSVKSFQIEIEAKQIMILRPKNMFEKCIFRASKGETPPPIDQPTATLSENVGSHNTLEETPIVEQENIVVTIEEPGEGAPLPPPPVIEDTPVSPQIEDASGNDVAEVVLEEAPSVPEPAILEVDFDINTIPTDDNMEIKERNMIYYQMYKEAKQKAKLARNIAISAYLEAKNIKNTYMLDDADDTDSDLNSDDYQNMNEF